MNVSVGRQVSRIPTGAHSMSSMACRAASRQDRPMPMVRMTGPSRRPRSEEDRRRGRRDHAGSRSRPIDHTKPLLPPACDRAPSIHERQAASGEWLITIGRCTVRCATRYGRRYRSSHHEARVAWRLGDQRSHDRTGGEPPTAPASRAARRVAWAHPSAAAGIRARMPPRPTMPSRATGSAAPGGAAAAGETAAGRRRAAADA